MRGAERTRAQNASGRELASRVHAWSAEGCRFCRFCGHAARRCVNVLLGLKCKGVVGLQWCAWSGAHAEREREGEELCDVWPCGMMHQCGAARQASRLYAAFRRGDRRGRGSACALG